MLLVAAHPEHDGHDAGPGHPEAAGRLVAAVAGVGDAELDGALEWLPERPATRPELARAHDPGYLDALADLALGGGGELDPDTAVGPWSWETAVATAGAGLGAAEALRAGRGDAALVLGRPPGHHATRTTGMGFCLLNNVAVTAAALVAAGERVAIVDWDVHHGNGTQDIFLADAEVLYVSVHQWPLYPGTGRVDERGAGPGTGTTVNLPLPPRSTGDTYLALFDEVVVPAVTAFAPDWILVSAGFDAHRDDPLGDMRLSAGDFADLTGRVAALPGATGRLVAFLEGGYDPAAVRSSVGACAARLAGGSYRPEPATSGGAGMARIPGYRAMFVEETSA